MSNPEAINYARAGVGVPKQSATPLLEELENETEVVLKNNHTEKVLRSGSQTSDTPPRMQYTKGTPPRASTPKSKSSSRSPPPDYNVGAVSRRINQLQMKLMGGEVSLTQPAHSE